MGLKYDPKVAKDLFVVNGMSIREVARQVGVSASAISERSIKEDWKGQKMAYDASIARRTYENMAEDVAREKGDIAKENVLAARATVRKYLTDLAAGKINVTTRDAVEMMKFLVQEMSPPGEASHADPRNVTPAPADQEFLKKLIEASRTKVAATPAIGDGLKVH